jgi:glycosyltransferase involved in cell wall biosynthesis
MKKVSVFQITYNHEKFIAEAIESIVSQVVDFEFELVIGEDCSRDNTRMICEQYAAKYPGIIKLLPSDKNYGAMGNTVRTLQACTGEYIAMCEGDDYWSDPHKLQKQIDFLEANPDYTICFSAVDVKDEMGWNLPPERYFPPVNKDTYTIEDFILSGMSIIPTPTFVFKNVLPAPFPDFFINAMAGDTSIQLFAADKGKAKFMSGKMAVYRNHEGGVTKTTENQEKGDPALMEFYKGFNQFTGFKYDAIFRKRFLSNAKANLIYGARNKKGLERISHYFERMPEYIKYSDKINLRELAYYHVLLFFPSVLRLFKKSAGA